MTTSKPCGPNGEPHSPLLESAMAAIGRSVPVKFQHEGRDYWLRISIGVVALLVFDSPVARLPMTGGIGGSTDEYGHTPGH